MVEEICSDMYDGFVNAARDVFGSKVMIVIDRFHVAKNYRGAFETLKQLFKHSPLLKKHTNSEKSCFCVNRLSCSPLLSYKNDHNGLICLE